MAQVPSGFVPDGFVPDAPEVAPTTAPPAQAQQQSLGGKIATAALNVAGVPGTAEQWWEQLKAVAKGTGQAIANHPAEAGAMALGTAMSLATAGLSTPAAVALTGLAGAGGAGFGMTTKELATGRPIPATEAATTMVEQGAAQGGGELIGRGIQAATAAGSRWLMNRALNLSAKLSEEFPEMSQWQIDHAITVSQGGLDQARTVLRTAKQVANTALTGAQQQGVTIPITAATDGLTRTLSTLSGSADIEGDVTTLAKIEKEIEAGRSGTLTPVEADALKQNLQKRARAAYIAAKSMGEKTAPVAAQGYEHAAASLNAAIDQATSDAGFSGYRAANGEAQQAIGAMRGIKRAIRPGSNLYQAMVRPGIGAVVGAVTGAESGGQKGALVGSVLGAAATSPGNMSRMAILIRHPLVREFIARAAPSFLTMLAGEPASSTPSEAP